ncbi:helix-turn-helix domain-containing protein [Cellulomonas oligotrophica]|uniref:Transcriptional regulator with XRE-family HTH domain n=1 Tax=Cellulomonas oligotrophica TaxID=931536 RepID=A0A7Y9FGJ4_9CELL|nr:helix-turn-helix transcriptional regulator [Cellulomonas oligotrophica]NYD86849.1 transcriptional regulator with XRE-family HTH domain [Cellulomonas oligotrophica]GIG32365.1 hypothetical protein Col01nite_15240 [Cellulomonas oligotrophica]
MDEREIGERVRELRLSRDLDQRDLAEAAGVSVTAVRRLEGGQGSTLRTALAVLAALEAPLRVPEVPTRTARRRASSATTAAAVLPRREERVSLELHRAVARKMRRDPAEVRAKALANLPKVRENVRGTQAAGWVDEWERALRTSTRAVLELALAQDEHGIDLRQVSPFAGVLTQDERMTAIARARR